VRFITYTQKHTHTYTYTYLYICIPEGSPPLPRELGRVGRTEEIPAGRGSVRFITHTQKHTHTYTYTYMYNIYIYIGGYIYRRGGRRCRASWGASAGRRKYLRGGVQ